MRVALGFCYCDLLYAGRLRGQQAASSVASNTAVSMGEVRPMHSFPQLAPVCYLPHGLEGFKAASRLSMVRPFSLTLENAHSPLNELWRGWLHSRGVSQIIGEGQRAGHG